MNIRDEYRRLNIEYRHPLWASRFIPVAISLGLLILIRLIMPAGVENLIEMLFVAVLGWFSSFGWRQALAAVRDFIHWLENL